MLFDTHCHAHFNAYREDSDAVIRRALENGVRMITVGTQKDTSRHGLEVAERYDGVWATIGLHPNHLVEQEFTDEDESSTIKTRSENFDLAFYQELAKHPKCVAIGECGLDYYRIPESADRDEVIQKQKETVLAHFALASEVDLPVILHCRDAYQDQANMVMEAIENGGLKRRGVVHCFTGTLEEAKIFITLGFFISFTGVITFPPRKTDAREDGLSSLQAVVRDLPLNSMLVETDSPYLTPVPHRGERNEPSYVKFVAEKIAELKGISFEEVADQTTANAKHLFRI